MATYVLTNVAAGQTTAGEVVWQKGEAKSLFTADITQEVRDAVTSGLLTSVPDLPAITEVVAGGGGTTDGLTDTQLRATAVPTSNAVIGAVADAAATSGNGTLVAILKAIRDALIGGTALVTPRMGSGGFLNISTNVDGVTYTAFASQVCKQLTVSCDVDITLQQGGTGAIFNLPANTPYTLFGLTNANTIAVRRKDTAITATSVQARWEA